MSGGPHSGCDASRLGSLRSADCDRDHTRVTLQLGPSGHRGRLAGWLARLSSDGERGDVTVIGVMVQFHPHPFW